MAKKQFIEEIKQEVEYNVIDLSATQQRLWAQTRAKFLWEQPGFAGILYSMMDAGEFGKERIIFTKDGDLDVAATDGRYVLANPDNFFKLTLPQRVFVLGHEVLHGIFNHCSLAYHLMKAGKVKFADGTELPYDDDTMQIAMDLVINAILIEGKIGEPPPNVYHDPKEVPHTMSVVEAYKKVYQSRQGGGGGGQSPQSGGAGQQGNGKVKTSGKGFDKHLQPGAVESKPAPVASAERNDTEWKQAVASAMANAAAQGKLPGSLLSLFKEIIEPAVDWQDHVKAFFARATGSGNYTWRRPDRRLIVRDMVGLGEAIYMPSQTGYGAECVVVVGDSSGSVTDPQLDRIMGEVSGILEDIKPKRLVLIWCDQKVQRIDEVEEVSDLNVIRAKGAPGRGGTSFIPPFNEVKQMGLSPDALIYITDGEGTFPSEAPRYPVIWASIKKPREHYPFGDFVKVPV